MFIIHAYIMLWIIWLYNSLALISNWQRLIAIRFLKIVSFIIKNKEFFYLHSTVIIKQNSTYLNRGTHRVYGVSSVWLGCGQEKILDRGVYYFLSKAISNKKNNSCLISNFYLSGLNGRTFNGRFILCFYMYSVSHTEFSWSLRENYRYKNKVRHPYINM